MTGIQWNEIKTLEKERLKRFMEKTRYMSQRVRKITDDSKAGEEKKVKIETESKRTVNRVEMISTKFPEGKLLHPKIPYSPISSILTWGKNCCCC